MADILSSKLFRASSRKSQILAAIQNPVNSELVSQVVDCLDEEFIDSKYLSPNISEDTNNAESMSSESTPEIQSDKGVEGEATPSHGHGPSIGSVPHMSPTLSDPENSEEMGEDVYEADAGADDLAEDVPEDAVESATISSDTLTLDSEQIIDILADKDVSPDRVAVKDSELWLYYNDSVNLNNMTDAIYVLSDLYDSLEFSRLARSNNAIVFDIKEEANQVIG